MAQTAQRVLHAARGVDTGEIHDFSLVKRLLQEETEDILARLRAAADVGQLTGVEAYAETEATYRKAVKIAMHWVKSYTDLDFRSLGSYTRQDLEELASAEDAF